MNVLSLFDGMSCGQLALNKANIKFDNYYASEIDEAAIKVTMHHHPNTIQLGSVTEIKSENLPTIDLLIGGSPCQGFSMAGKLLNFDDPRSALFFEYVRLLKELKPKYFFLENVVMKKEWQDIISEQLGCQPVMINSALVSAQNRRRLYWTNIPFTGLPLDKKISWSDIAEDNWFAGAMRGRRLSETGSRSDYDLSIPIKQYAEARKNNKTNCVTTVGKDNIAIESRCGRTDLKDVKWRYLTRKELERLQTLPDGYTDVVSYSKAQHMIGNGWTVDIVSWFFSFLNVL